jgi:hypothetical protein
VAFLPEIGTYLVSTVTAQTLVLGTNLFLGRLPDTPDICVAVIETAGQSAVDAMGVGEVRRTPEHQRETRIEVRCANCVKKLALMVTAPWRIQCPRCKMINESA